MTGQSFPVTNWLAHLDGGIAGIAGYSTSDGHQHVFVATRSGDVRQLEMDPGVGFWAWRLPIMHHDVIRGLTAYHHPGDGREHVFAATDSEVWEYMWRPGEQPALNWLAHLDGGIAGIAGYSTSDSHQHVFVATRSGDVRQIEIDPTIGFWAWRPPIIHHDVIAAVTAYFHPADNRQHIFTATESEIWEVLLCGPSVIQFPVAWFDGLKNLGAPAEMAKDGVNLIVAANRGTLEEAIPYLNEVSAQCLRVMVEVNPDGYDPQQVEELITTLKDRFEIWDWYLFDEPEGYGISAAVAKQAYQKVKSLDPSRRVAIAFRPGSDAATVAPYLDATDIYMVDVYPILKAYPDEFGNLSGFYGKLLEHSAYASPKPFWPILQANDYVWARLPTFLEERYMIYAAIQAGAGGLFFWSRSPDALSTPQWATAVLAPLITEFKQYVAAFVKGALSSKVSSSDISTRAKLYSRGGAPGYILLLVHHGGGAITTRITLETSIAFATVRERGQLLAANVLESDLTLAPYEARVFELL